MIADWLRLFGGVLRIRVRGAEPERFLNACKQHRIMLRKIRRMDIDELHAELSLRDFYRLAAMKQRTRCRVHIQCRRGFPFWVRKARRRPGLWLGVLCMLFLCYELYTRIWVIETDFPAGVDGAAVMRELERMDIGIGTKREDIDAKSVKIHMMTTLDDLKFFALNLDGNVMSVETEAATPAPEVDNDAGIHDVVAVRDGVIQKQVVRQGTEQYEVGDAVIAGSILVDARMESTTEWGTPRLVDASADIWAATRYYVTSKMPLEANKKYKSDRCKTRYAICFGKTRINLYFGSSLTQGNCDRIISIESVRLNDHLAFPFSLYRECIIPYRTKTVRHTAQQRADRMQYGAKQYVLRQLEQGNVTSMQADCSEEQDAAMLSATVWCYEQIGVGVEDGRTQADIQPAPDTQEESTEE